MEAQIYELAYHLDANLDEAKLQAARTELEQLLTSHAATIVFTKEPEKTRLSYEIRHERASYFGYFHFTIEDRQQLGVIDEQLRLNTQLIRYVMLKVEPTTKKSAKPRMIPQRKIEKQEGEVVNPALDQQLEEVISGL